jgi:VWFA-related protein
MTGILIALTVTFATAFADPRAQQAVERPASHMVIDVVAQDKKGMPVTDLRREELEVWIGGYRVPFETFSAVTAGDVDRGGRLIVLVLDDYVLPPQLVPRAREAARRFVNRMSPGDQMAIVTLNGSMMESTDDRRRLLGAIDRYNSRGFGVQRIDTIGEHVLKTMSTLSRQLGAGPYGRKAIVGIGASWLFDLPIPPPSVGRDLRPEWTEAMREMAQSNVSLYVIEPGGVGISPMVGGSNGFARETGGHSFLNTNDLTGAADRIMREAANYYLIGVADPPIQRKAELRELEVKVLRPGVTVRARRAIAGSR